MFRSLVRPAGVGRPRWIALGIVVGALVGSSVQGAQAAAPAQAEPAKSPFAFAADGALVLNYIKPDKTADFEDVIAKLKEALAKSEKPERKQQAASWKIFKQADPVPAGGNNEVFWQFQNVSGMTRQLIRLEVTWPQQAGRLLQDVRFNALPIWNLGTNISPVTIDSNFLGGPTARHINDTVARPLQLTFNFNVTGGQEFTVKAFWDDTGGGSICDSGSITVVRP